MSSFCSSGNCSGYLFDISINCNYKVCNINSWLAQIFSRSVARGLRFYQNYEADLKFSESTAVFCETLNDMFDALNRTLTTRGLTLDCDDMKVFLSYQTIINLYILLVM